LKVSEGGALNIEYDARLDAAYINLSPMKPGDAKKTYACDPEEVGGQIQLDFDESGRLIGIEVLHASRMLPASLLKAGNPAK
jgi:uncharacterized protein YuzE